MVDIVAEAECVCGGCRVMVDIVAEAECVCGGCRVMVWVRMMAKLSTFRSHCVKLTTMNVSPQADFTICYFTAKFV